MKTADSALLYNTHPVVNELNRVKGFDPLRFIKVTSEGPKLELKYKKIWFRLSWAIRVCLSITGAGPSQSNCWLKDTL